MSPMSGNWCCICFDKLEPPAYYDGAYWDICITCWYEELNYDWLSFEMGIFPGDWDAVG